VRTSVRVLAEVWRGIWSTKEEISAGRISLEGPGWLLLSVYAPIEKQR
jgi:hypothetical protein